MAPSYEVTFIDTPGEEVRFLVRGATPAFANGLRRAMLADVPTVSIDDLRVYENSSVMFDEMIGLRLGLVPLKSPPGELDPEETVTLALDVEGPATAYSGDLVSSDPAIEVARENIPIIHLKENQRLELEADAVLDAGRNHAKHQGGIAVGYSHLQRTEVVGDADEFEEQGPQIVRGVIEEGAPDAASDEDASEGDLVPATSFGNDLTNRYPGKDIWVTDIEDAFVFHVEPDGSMSVEDLVLTAAKSLGDRAEELENAVQL